VATRYCINGHTPDASIRIVKERFAHSRIVRHWLLVTNCLLT